MARIPDLKRLSASDFPSKYQDLIEQLAFPINSHIEQVRSALNKNINFENLAQELITLTFQTNSEGQPLNKLTFKSNLNNRIQGMIPISLNITSSNTSFPSQAPFISFSQNSDIVTINNIAGLAPEASYQLIVLTIS